MCGVNTEILHALRSMDLRGLRRVLWIVGRPGSGKTHLLQSAVAEAGSGAMYLPLRTVRARGIEVLRGVEELPFVALDDVDAVAASDEWERELFRFFNDAQAGTGGLVFASRRRPADAGFKLDDLTSRLTSATVYRLEPLDDTQSLKALQKHALARGLELSDASASYLLKRVSRDMADICGWLDDLDGASLAAKRKLTVPFIRDAIAARA